MTRLRSLRSLVACSLLLACASPTGPGNSAQRQSARRIPPARLAVAARCYPVTFEATPLRGSTIYEDVLTSRFSSLGSARRSC